MNNCQRIAQVFRNANKCTMTRSELESALHKAFRNIKDFLALRGNLTDRPF